jgi:hypothetical protein
LLNFPHKLSERFNKWYDNLKDPNRIFTFLFLIAIPTSIFIALFPKIGIVYILLLIVVRFEYF